MTSSRPFIVGVGGTAQTGSSTERALAVALNSAEACGARTKIYDGAAITALPHYLTPQSRDSESARALVSDIREASGLIIASPGYHGSISGIVKNAIDYLEETAKDERIYLDGVPVGLIATAYGWQAAGTTLATLRSIIHALRGWPTPFGAAINSSKGIFREGICSDAAAAEQLALVGRQVFEFASLKLRDPRLTEILTATERLD